MASLKGFPFRLTPLIARTLSPIWMAPVLQGEESREDKDLESTRQHWSGLSCCLGLGTLRVPSVLTETGTKELFVVTQKDDTAIVYCCHV